MKSIRHTLSKTSLRFIAIALLALYPPAYALTMNTEVTPDYIKEHSKEFSVTVTKTKDGLLEFTITQNAGVPWYIVASLSLRKGGAVVAESYFPPLVQQKDITFSFRVAPEFVAESEFEIGDCAFVKDGDRVIPVPGTNNYIFKLKDFAPREPFLPVTAKAAPSVVTPSPAP